MSSPILRFFTTIFLLSVTSIALSKTTKAPEPEYATPVTPIVNLTEINIDDHIQNSNLGSYFVMFYAPWCSHSKAATPAWLQLAKKTHGKVNIAIVDCEANNYLKRRFSIGSYPSFVYFANNTLYEYKGERTVEAWSDFLNGGYKNVEPEEIPLKASTMRDISKQVNQVFKQFKYAVTNHPLFVAGVFGFIVLMTVISFNCVNYMNEKLGLDDETNKKKKNDEGKLEAAETAKLIAESGQEKSKKSVEDKKKK